MKKLFLLIFSLILLILIPLISWQLARVTNNVRSFANKNPSAPTISLPSEKNDPRKKSIIKYNQAVVSNQILVKFKSQLRTKIGVSSAAESLNFTDIDSSSIPSSFSSLNEKYKVSNVAKVFKSANNNLANVYKVTLANGTSVNQAVSDLQKSGQVEYAQPNYKMKVYYAPNDYYYNRTGDWGQAYADLWGLKNKLQMANAWDISKGAGITVAVVDTGIDYTHPDISANVAGGWNFVNNSPDYKDDNGHGTHVAGIIAATGNNKIGIIGVAPQAKLLGVKFLDANGSGDTDTGAQAILYAAQNGAKVINNSWGCSYACPSNPVVEDAVKSAQNDYNATVVFAAGNSADDVISYSPQNMVSAKPIVVASEDYNDRSSFFSNFGYLIDITAPGGPDLNQNLSFGNILSLAASNCQICDVTIGGGNYALLTGTSMATPYVSGLAADIISKYPSLTPQQIRQKIRAGAYDLGPAGYDPLFGAGLSRAVPALTNSVLITQITAPAAGSNFDSTTGAVAITGTARGNNFARYLLSYRRADSATWITISSSTSAVDNGLLGTLQTGNLGTGEYVIRLQATNIAGLQFKDFDEFFLQKQTPRQISFTQGSDRDALAMSGNLVVWEDGRNQDCSFVGGNCDIFLYDFNLNKEVQITTNTSTQRWPAISGNRIVWEDYRSGNYEIYTCTYNPTSGQCDNETKLSNGVPHDEEFPQIDGNLVIWTDFRNGPGNIYLYDFSTNKVRTIMSRGSVVGPLTISGNLIAWTDRRNTIYHIYACRYNATTGACPVQQITSGTRYQYDPHVSGNRFVWTDYASMAGDYDFTGEIYTCVLTSTGCSPVNISKNKFDQYQGVVSGNLIVWTDNRNNMLKVGSEGIKFRNYDLYLYDAKSLTRRQLTSSTIEVEGPVVNAQRIVYLSREQGGPWGFSNIYSLDLPTTYSAQNALDLLNEEDVQQ